jgi:hypothetical protein
VILPRNLFAPAAGWARQTQAAARNTQTTAKTGIDVLKCLVHMEPGPFTVTQLLLSHLNFIDLTRADYLAIT